LPAKAAWHLALGLAVLFSCRPPLHATPHHGGATHARLHRNRHADPAQALGAKIVAFAASRQGSQVGSGECFDLVQQALQSAGASGADAFGDITPEGDYVWGTPVRLQDLRPGDVLQFRDYRITRRITTMMQLSDGNVARSQSQAYEERDHHTAIVEAAAGDSVWVLEQNVDPAGRVVQQNRVALASHTEEETHVEDRSLVRTEIEVDGEVRAYRPRKATATQVADANK
jgi:hypothetical protein